MERCAGDLKTLLESDIYQALGREEKIAALWDIIRQVGTAVFALQSSTPLVVHRDIKEKKYNLDLYF